MSSILKIMEQMAGAHEEALEKIVAPAEKDFLRICSNAERRIETELRRLTKRLAMNPTEIDIQLDIARTEATLSNVLRLHNEHITNAGVDWATKYYPDIVSDSIKRMNEFKLVNGISLDTFADLDKTQIRVALQSWKGSLIQAGDSYKQFVSKTITEHIIAGIGTKADLVKKLMDDDGLLPTTTMTRKTRAGGQARNELIRISRETNAIKDRNEKHFRMAGPMDSRCEKICLRHNGRILSRREWLKINLRTFSEGLHYGCRHKFYAIKKEWLDDEEKEAMNGNKRILYSKKDRKFIQDSDVPNNFLKLKPQNKFVAKNIDGN